MTQALIASLQALAAPAQLQMARFPDFVVRADELALDFADSWLAIRQRQGQAWTQAQHRLLESLDFTLSAMGGQANELLWTDDALLHSSEWIQIRVLAREALLSLGAPIEEPPPSGADYIPG